MTKLSNDVSVERAHFQIYGCSVVLSFFSNFDRTILLANSEDPNQKLHHPVLIWACIVCLSPIKRMLYSQIKIMAVDYLPILSGMSNRSRVNSSKENLPYRLNNPEKNIPNTTFGLYKIVF